LYKTSTEVMLSLVKAYLFFSLFLYKTSTEVMLSLVKTYLFFQLVFCTKRVNLYRKTKLEDSTRVLFSLDDLFILIEGFWRLAVFNEA